MNEYESFFDALDEAVQRAGNMNRLARYSGIPVQSISRWVARERTPSLEGIVQLLPFINWPKRGGGPVMKRVEGNSVEEPVEGDNLIRIPVILEAGAGNPVDVWEGEPERFIDILPRYFRKDVRAVEVVGDSMEPTIKKGAIVGVEPFSGEFKEGGIYLVRLPYFGLLVKRIHMDGMSGIVLISDNKQYHDMRVPFVDCENLIVGHVAWYWQEA